MSNTWLTLWHTSNIQHLTHLMTYQQCPTPISGHTSNVPMPDSPYDTQAMFNTWLALSHQQHPTPDLPYDTPAMSNTWIALWYISNIQHLTHPTTHQQRPTSHLPCDTPAKSNTQITLWHTSNIQCRSPWNTPATSNTSLALWHTSNVQHLTHPKTHQQHPDSPWNTPATSNTSLALWHTSNVQHPTHIVTHQLCPTPNSPHNTPAMSNTLFTLGHTSNVQHLTHPLSTELQCFSCRGVLLAAALVLSWSTRSQVGFLDGRLSLPLTCARSLCLKMKRAAK